VSAALILRLRALLGLGIQEQDEPEALGAVYSALLAVEGERAIALVASVLKEGDDLAAEPRSPWRRCAHLRRWLRCRPVSKPTRKVGSARCC